MGPPNREPENSRPTRKAALQLLPLAAMAANAQFNEIGKAFVGHYYQMFDASIEQRSTLQSMYQDASMLTFENEQFMGMQASQRDWFCAAGWQCRWTQHQCWCIKQVSLDT